MEDGNIFFNSKNKKTTRTCRALFLSYQAI
jgi:hypothetical protein